MREGVEKVVTGSKGKPTRILFILIDARNTYAYDF